MKNQVEPEELTKRIYNTKFVLADRHGYDNEGIDTLHRDIIRLITGQHYGITLTPGEMQQVLGTFENPNNLVEALEHTLEEKGIELLKSHNIYKTDLFSLGDLVCSREPGEMKTRNLVGRAAKHARLNSINQYTTLMDMLEKEGNTSEVQELAKKFHDLTKRRFDSLKGAEKYITFSHLVGNADVLPSKLIEATTKLDTLIDIYKESGIFHNVAVRPTLLQTNYIPCGCPDMEDPELSQTLMLPYSIDFKSDIKFFDKEIDFDTCFDGYVIRRLLTHETLDTKAVGDGRNVEGRKLYDHVIRNFRPTEGFSGDTHQPTQQYHVKVPGIDLKMTQVSPDDIVRM